jgi:hypothetical protein
MTLAKSSRFIELDELELDVEESVEDVEESSLSVLDVLESVESLELVELKYDSKASSIAFLI